MVFRRFAPSRSLFLKGIDLALALFLGSFTSALAATGWLGIVTQPTQKSIAAASRSHVLRR
mgnify:CR=1 FL=1